jgi:hypothetical protein
MPVLGAASAQPLRMEGAFYASPSPLEASGRALLGRSRSFHREFVLFVKAIFSNLEGWKDWKDYLQ